MNLNEIFNVSPGKVEALKEKIARLGIDMSKVEEQFTRGGGKGGQKINKTANRVVLRYAPLNLVVGCQRERQRSVNRFLALRELADRIEMIVSPRLSERLKERDRVRKQKDRRERRAESRHAPKRMSSAGRSDVSGLSPHRTAPLAGAGTERMCKETP